MTLILIGYLIACLSVIVGEMYPVRYGKKKERQHLMVVTLLV